MTSERTLNFTTETERLRFFVAGLASLNLSTPRGKRHDVHHAQQLREIRNAARLLLGDSHDQ